MASLRLIRAPRLKDVLAEALVKAGARLVPFDFRLGSLERKLLAETDIYPPVNSYSRFTLALVLFPAAVQTLLLITAGVRYFFITLPLIAVQALPFMMPYYLRLRRRKAAENELPFAAMAFYVLSYESFPNLSDAFSRLQGLGSTFPCMSRESMLLRRNLMYRPGSEISAIESTFSSHPSPELRSFIRGYLKTLTTGRDVNAFVSEECDRFIDLVQARWRSFVGLVSSLTEVAFILLALLPVGVQMITTTLLPDGSLFLLASMLLVIVASAAVLISIDLAQPTLYDRVYPAPRILPVLLCLSIGLALNYFGILTATSLAVLIFSVTLGHSLLARGHYRALHSGERSVASFLHDVAEDVRAGSSLPSSLQNHLEQASEEWSLRPTLGRFVRQLELGKAPHEAQAELNHPSWTVRLSFAMIALALETGSGYEQLDRLSLLFRKIHDIRSSIRAAILPFILLGLSVPVISVGSLSIISGMQIPGISFGSLRGGTGTALLSIVVDSLFVGAIITKAYSLAVRSLSLVPPVILSSIIALFIFGQS